MNSAAAAPGLHCCVESVLPAQLQYPLDLDSRSRVLAFQVRVWACFWIFQSLAKTCQTPPDMFLHPSTSSSNFLRVTITWALDVLLFRGMPHKFMRHYPQKRKDIQGPGMHCLGRLSLEPKVGKLQGQLQDLRSLQVRYSPKHGPLLSARVCDGSLQRALT